MARRPSDSFSPGFAGIASHFKRGHELSFVVSLPNDNDYQGEQATAAAETAERLAADIRVAGITTGMAVELVNTALRGGAQPPERTLIEAQSCPSLERLEEIGKPSKNDLQFASRDCLRF